MHLYQPFYSLSLLPLFLFLRRSNEKFRALITELSVASFFSFFFSNSLSRFAITHRGDRDARVKNAPCTPIIVAKTRLAIFTQANDIGFLRNSIR